MATEVINEFEKNILDLLAFEYGDFKRKVGNYLNRMEDQLQPAAPDAKRIINDVRTYVVFSPNSNDIEMVRARLLTDVERLRNCY